MKLRLIPILSLIAALAAFPALALDLQQARNAGTVGEKATGYAEALKPAADVNALVADVNAKRRLEYERISKQNSQPMDVVAKLAAQQIISGLPSGAMYQAADGSWKKR